MTNKQLARILLGLILSTLVGCSKNLTESSAQHMLTVKISADKADDYLVSFNDVRNTIKDETREDYSQGIYEKMTPGPALFSLPDPKLAVQRLLKAGFITQSRKDITIPNVSGDYHVHLMWPKG